MKSTTESASLAAKIAHLVSELELSYYDIEL